MSFSDSKPGTATTRTATSSRHSSTKKILFIDHLIRKELTTLERDLQTEVQRLHTPPRKEYTPYVFNKLTPYGKVKEVKYLISLPNVIKYGYSNRPMATDICDPWVSLNMDKQKLPRIADKQLVQAAHVEPRVKGYSARHKDDLPAYPVVRVPTEAVCKGNQQLTYEDVPKIRQILCKKNMKVNAIEKDKADYLRTKQDYDRLALKRFGELPEGKRSRMKLTYFAYLRNTPGSSKAIRECVDQTYREIVPPQQQQQPEEWQAKQY